MDQSSFLTHANVFATSPTPDVVWHLKADDQDSLAESLGPLPKRVGVAILVD